MKFKQLPWIALITAMTLVISACGGAQQPAAAPTAAPVAPAAEAPTAAPAAEAPAVAPTQVIEFAQEPTANQKVVVWMVRTGIQENKWERDVVLPAFAKAQPDIFVKVININQDDIAVKREAMIAAKEPLHVWSTNWGGDGFASDRYRGLITDLTPLIERDKFDTSDYIPEVLSIYKSEGKQWGLPFLTTGTYIYYNMKLFDDAKIAYPTSDWNDKSWTWDAFVELGKKMTKNYEDPNTGVYGIATGDLWPKFDAVPFIWGKDVWSKQSMIDGFSDPIKLTDPTIITAYQKFHDLAYVDKVAPDDATGQALSQLGGAFQSGRVAMSMAGGWGHWSYKDLINDPNGFCWGVAPLPWGTPDANMRATIFTDPWVITAGMDASNTDMAWTFLKFLASPEQAKAYSLTSGAPPTRSSLLQEYYKQYEKCMPVDKFEQAFIGAFSHGRESTNHLLIKYDEASTVWDNAMGPFWNDPAAKSETLLTQVEKDVNDTLARIKTEVKKP
jgi:multiple sugar transport system substrate-binding protein